MGKRQAHRPDLGQLPLFGPSPYFPPPAHFPSAARPTRARTRALAPAVGWDLHPSRSVSHSRTVEGARAPSCSPFRPLPRGPFLSATHDVRLSVLWDRKVIPFTAPSPQLARPAGSAPVLARIPRRLQPIQLCPIKSRIPALTWTHQAVTGSARGYAIL